MNIFPKKNKFPLQIIFALIVSSALIFGSLFVAQPAQGDWFNPDDPGSGGGNCPEGTSPELSSQGWTTEDECGNGTDYREWVEDYPGSPTGSCYVYICVEDEESGGGGGGCTPNCSAGDCGQPDGCGGNCSDWAVDEPGMCGNCNPAIPGDCPPTEEYDCDPSSGEYRVDDPSECVVCQDSSWPANNDLTNCPDLPPEPCPEDSRTLTCEEYYGTPQYQGAGVQQTGTADNPPTCSPYTWTNTSVNCSYNPSGGCGSAPNPIACTGGRTGQITYTMGAYPGCQITADESGCDCPGTLEWNPDTEQCYDPNEMTGTLTPESGSCVIGLYESVCEINFFWEVTNPEGNTTVTRSPGITVATVDSGNEPFDVPRGNITFSLQNNSQLLDQATVSGACASGTQWNGTRCEPDSDGPGSGMSGTLTPAVFSCLISSGNDGCNINFTWSVTNPESSTTTRVKREGTQVGSGNPGSGALFVPFLGATFTLENNSKQLDAKNVFSSCNPPLAWNGSACVSGGPTTITATCVATPVRAKVNETVVWSLDDLVGGSGSYTIEWSGTDIPTYGFQGPGFDEYTINYPTAGHKDVFATITDSAGNTGQCSGTAGLGGDITIYVKLPEFIEN